MNPALALTHVVCCPPEGLQDGPAGKALHYLSSQWAKPVRFDTNGLPHRQTVVPWERLQVPEELNGTQGTFRGPPSGCTLSADNDYEAVQAWLALHESSATKRAYRKEAERLILWAVVERGRALSSLTTEDATAYRGFLRNPAPRSRWVGPPQTRFSAEWRPFAAGL